MGISSHDSSVALFLPTLTAGGIERCFLNLAEGFLDQDITVDLVVADLRGRFISQIPDGVNVVNLGADRTLKAILPLRNYLNTIEPSVLLSGHTHANIAAILASKTSRAKTKIAVGIHNTLSQKSATGFMSRAVQFLYPHLYKLADEIIAVSEGVKQDLLNNINLDPEVISVIHNPVSINSVVKQSMEKVSHEWLSDESLQVVLGAGRLTKQKDFETLIRAFVDVQKVNKQARLIIAGTGDKKELEDLATDLGVGDKIDLVGYVDNLYAYMRLADIFVLSSQWEGFGIVLVEAMAVGTPVVSTDCPHGPAEILQNGEFGELVPVGDSKQLSDSICNTLSKGQDTKTLESRAADFSAKNIAKTYAETLRV